MLGLGLARDRLPLRRPLALRLYVPVALRPRQTFTLLFRGRSLGRRGFVPAFGGLFALSGVFALSGLPGLGGRRGRFGLGSGLLSRNLGRGRDRTFRS